MVLHLIGQSDRYLLDGVSFFLGQKAVLLHSGDHKVSSFERSFRVEGRIVSCRLVYHSDKSGGLLDGKVGRGFAEERLGRSLDTVCIAAEEDLIHVHVHDLVLGIASFELDGRHPFLELGPYHLERGTAHVFTWIEGLGKLLGYGTSSSLA